MQKTNIYLYAVIGLRVMMLYIRYQLNRNSGSLKCLYKFEYYDQIISIILYLCISGIVLVKKLLLNKPLKTCDYCQQRLKLYADVQ